MSDDRTWEASHDRTPAQNLRALLRHLDPETPTAEITRIAFIRIPGLGPGDERIVETIREEFADEHALARAEQWLGDREAPPQITLDEDRRRLPSDTDGVVHPAEVRAVLAHRLGARPPRTCDNGSLIACNGPDDHGCRCPECGQQRRREEAILDAVRTAWTADRLDATPFQTVVTDGGERR